MSLDVITDMGVISLGVIPIENYEDMDLLFNLISHFVSLSTVPLAQLVNDACIVAIYLDAALKVFHLVDVR